MSNENQRVETDRIAIVRRLERWLEVPLFVLGVVWLVLLIVELVGRINPALELLGTLIWIVFVCEFLLRFAFAPRRSAFLRRNVLTILALLLPALRVLRVARVFRVLRLARLTRGVRLIRLITSFNRGMKALAATLGRRGFGYVVLLTGLVTVLGAAGMYAFENGVSGGSLDSYGTALWWTAMLMTTMGSEYWPRTPEGRILCFLLSLYAFGVFGYVTATIATFFIGRDAENEQAEVAGSQQIENLARQIAVLHAELREWTNKADRAR